MNAEPTPLSATGLIGGAACAGIGAICGTIAVVGVDAGEEPRAFVATTVKV